MTIDDNIDFLNEAKKFYEEVANNPSLNETMKTYFTIEALENAIDIMHKYQKMKADYEERLKSDLVAILTEIELEIDELDSRAGYDGNGMPTFSSDYIRKKKVNELIQQKIDALKLESEEEDD